VVPFHHPAPSLANGPIVTPKNPDRLFKGRLLEDRYELLSCIGEGGAGAVWVAEDRTLRITVAVKVMRPELSKRKAMQEKFEQEAELSARMMSPNIVRVFTRGMDADGTAYIVYELLDGEDLGTRIERKKRLDLVETETVVVHVARALSRAHAVGVVHRDVKPGNIFLTKDEVGRLLAKILDFGVAEVIAKADPTASLSGTLEYMAPEILLEGKPPSARSDLYSLAVVAYRCLAGHVPFTGDALGEVMVALATTTRKTLAESLGVSGMTALEEWLDKGLHRDPDQRFGTARELAESFHAAVKHAKGIAPQLAVPTPEDKPPASYARTAADEHVDLDVKRSRSAMQAVGSAQGPFSALRQSRTVRAPPAVPRPSAPAKAPPPLPASAPKSAPTSAPKSAPRSAPQAQPGNLPPMRARAQSFVFDEEDLNGPPSGSQVLAQVPLSTRPPAARVAVDVVEVDALDAATKRDDRRR
jgi:serine/threonine protein kinase